MAHDWANFFSALAQVSGALVGLVFVALTFNAKTLLRGGDPLMGALARQTFSDFLLLLIVSMLMLVPHFSALDMGEGLLIMVALGIGRILRDLFRLREHLRRLRIAQRFFLSLLGHAFLGAAGAELLRGAIGSGLTGSLLLSGTSLLLLSGCRSAWVLVVHEKP
ncbi:MAG: hypothetical protein KJS83_03090 [Xanthomonadaceae bacterium]|nr:hypothetical protein [Xanthomonadaceae bacterium]MDE2054648.1 hypothetical protein [Xanthomonadaceae bacterium]MDE2224179.1 hypothetical protein [Xanthomonadaceae bacterium]